MSDAPTTPASYTRTAKTLHWMAALFMSVMLIFGWGLEDMPLDEKVQTLVIHSSLGISVLLLMIARLLWRRGHPAPDLPNTMPSWQATASKASHFALYFFAITQPIWGIGQSLFAKYDVSPFGVGSLSQGYDATLNQIFHVLHGLNAFILSALVILHIVAALYHHFIQKDIVLKRMLPFSKI